LDAIGFEDVLDDLLGSVLELIQLGRGLTEMIRIQTPNRDATFQRDRPPSDWDPRERCPAE